MSPMPPLTRRAFSAIAGSLAAHPKAWSAAPAIDGTLRGGIAQRKIPAAVGMAANGKKVLYTGAFGTRDASGAPVAANSIFAIASMTKPVTTVAALQLVE